VFCHLVKFGKFWRSVSFSFAFYNSACFEKNGNEV
jgi:hypothetical protein